MPDSQSSSDSPISRRDLWVAALLLAALSGLATWFCYQRGYLLYYGDAEAHHAIARRLIDSRTPGWDNIGTVWLPLPHFLAVPFVANDFLWRSGLASAIPNALCYVLGGLLLLDALGRVTGHRGAAWVGLGVVAANPNLLYLQAAPMTEATFYAASVGMLWATSRYARDPGPRWAAVIALAANAACLTRYDGWFLTGVAGLFVLWKGGVGRFRNAAVYGAIAAISPAWWLAHNWWYYGDPLEFYRGEYSALAIYERALKQPGSFRAPGDHDAPLALRVYAEAARLAAGTWPMLVASVGVLLLLLKRRWAAVFVVAGPFFYIWSLYSTGQPIFVPTLWPNSYYNTRYALSILPFLGLGIAQVASWNLVLRGVVLAVGIAPWILNPSPEAWVTWKESEINSRARRPWVEQAGQYLREHYRSGTGIMTSSGDVMAVYRAAGIPFEEVLFDANNPQFVATLRFPKIFLKEKWLVAQEGDAVDAMARSMGYRLVRRIAVRGATPLLMYETR